MYACVGPHLKHVLTLFNRPPLVQNAQIRSASLHNPLPLYLHTYIWPFLAIWPAFLAVYLSEERYDKYIAGSEWTFVWFGSIFSLQTLTWLTTKWNVNIAALFTTIGTRDVRNAKLIKVIPVTNAGASEICKLERDNVRFLQLQRLSFCIDECPRSGVDKTSRFCSRRGNSRTTSRRTSLRPFRSTSTKARGRLSIHSSKPRACLLRPRSIEHVNIMVTTRSTFRCPLSQNCGRSTLSPHSLSFSSSVLVCGYWTTTGTTLCSHSSCSSDLKVRSFGSVNGPYRNSAG